jgi:hypothetical protein
VKQYWKLFQGYKRRPDCRHFFLYLFLIQFSFSGKPLLFQLSFPGSFPHENEKVMNNLINPEGSGEAGIFPHDD